MAETIVTPREDRTIGFVAYVLFFIGLPTVHLATLIGLVVAYANRGEAGPMMKSHYTFLIRTFWLTFWWVVIGILLAVFGGLFSLVLVGVPFLIAGIAILGLVHLWFVVRLVLGVVYLIQDKAYPRPMAWLF